MCLLFELCLNCIFYWFYRNFENKVGQMGQGPENGRFLRNTVCFHRVTGRKASPREDLQENGTARGALILWLYLRDGVEGTCADAP